jgi:23S rRNA pseudouridine2457 synthase
VTVVFHKPYGVVSQFTPLGGHKTLADFGLPKGVYPCGRLDHDSEGLLVLTDDGRLQSRLSEPRCETPRTYWAQVERLPSAQALARLAGGLALKDGRTKPCRARLLDAGPGLPERLPPIRARKSVPTAWLEIKLSEGRNRQVRRMMAAIGHPTLRLVRVSHGPFRLHGLQPGQWRFEKFQRKTLAHDRKF